MFRQLIQIFVYGVLLYFYCSLGFAASGNSSKALVVKMVSRADYQIGREGSTQAIMQKAEKSLVSSEVQIKRQLTSLYSGESGDRVPARGFLTDVVWTEQTTTAGVSHERILYYSFNVGRWKNRLDSETTVLTRAFMTQPLLVFLSASDKAQIAEQLVKLPSFEKAVAEYKSSLTNPFYDLALLDNLIATLGAEGVARLDATQQQASKTALQAKMAEGLNNTEFASTTTTGTTEIDFRYSSKKYQVFQGLKVHGTRDINNNNKEQFYFTSYSSLHYGVQQLNQFTNPDTSIWDNLTVPLIKPVTGWLDKDLVKGTPVSLSVIKPLETTGNSANVVIFRNNPNVYFDAPMIMNMMTAGAILAETTGTLAAFFKPDLMGELVTKTKDWTSKPAKFLNNAALVYSLAKSAQKLGCTIAESKEGICKDYAKRLDVILAWFKPFGSIIPAMEETLKNGMKDQPFDADTFCAGAIVSSYVENTFQNKARRTSLDDNTQATKLALCAFNEMATKPVLRLLKNNAGTVSLYKELQAEGFAAKPIA